mmetsp:Transcript_5591/g.8518  ORF Transcript_5591/g.8518 Transcript_5591/m.8518 type:complete len:203 (-) Transcript_5591:206-814(-)
MCDTQSSVGKSECAESQDVVEPHHFYVNIELLNKDDAIKNKVKEKAGVGIFGKAAASAANSLVSDDALVNKLSENLMTKIPEAIAEMGMRATVTKAFQKRLYVVLRMEILEIDKLTLIRHGKGPEFAEKFETLLECLNSMGIEGALTTIDSNISHKVREGMMEKFGSIIPLKMAEAGMIVCCDVLGPERQADYFFEKLRRTS